MSDKSKPSHTERTVYVQPSVTPGSSLRYGDWQDSEANASRCGNCYGSGTTHDRSYRDVRCDVCRGSGRVKPLPLTIIEYATGSDYSGNLCEISNARSLKRDFPWLVELHGGYSTQGVAYLGKRENQSDALIEAIDALASYPLYDENDHSDLEMVTVDEQWADSYGGRHDFKRGLVEFFDSLLDEDHEHDLDDDKHNAAVDQLWYDACEILRGGEDHINEQGDAIYFPVDRVIEDFTRSGKDLDRCVYGGARPTLREQITALCDASRTPVETCGKCGEEYTATDCPKCHP